MMRLAAVFAFLVACGDNIEIREPYCFEVECSSPDTCDVECDPTPTCAEAAPMCNSFSCHAPKSPDDPPTECTCVVGGISIQCVVPFSAD